MPIIGKVGRKSFKVKGLNFSIHLVLLIGAITMIYPFMIMISSSFNSNVDASEFAAYPRFFFDDNALFQKYCEARLNEESTRLISRYQNRFSAFDFVQIPTKIDITATADWQDFAGSHSFTANDYYVSEQYGRGIYPRNERAFRNLMKDENDSDIKLFNQRYGTNFITWDEVRIEEKMVAGRNFETSGNNFLERYQIFRRNLPDWHRTYLNLSGDFVAMELLPAYGGDLNLLNEKLSTNYQSWQEIILPQSAPDNQLLSHWQHYVSSKLNLHHLRLLPAAQKSYQNYLQEKYEQISLLNQTYQSGYFSFAEIELPDLQNIVGAAKQDAAFFIENIASAQQLMIEAPEYDFRKFLQQRYGSIENLNATYSRELKHWKALDLSPHLPQDNLQMAADWSEFVQKQADLSQLRLSPNSQKEFLLYLQKVIGSRAGKLDLAAFNQRFQQNVSQEIDLYPARTMPSHPAYRQLWIDFVQNVVSPKFLQITAIETENWQNFLQDKYRSLDNLNAAYNYNYQNFQQVQIDYFQNDYAIFKAHKRTIFWEFVARNYIMVLDVMLYNGRAILNTLIYTSLAILAALIVNPLAAYAMSRFKLKATYKIILILMLTMAFPPMVMGIPSFLLLKNLNLLNTFWALILPAAADGYFIFLLKGFFDSLPQELFESATIDGASETRIFWQIAMSLSKPIMAVIALGAFNAAYRNFMFAFIVCQDQSMWTMMVHIYQLMQRSTAGVGFAALVIAAIPTFLVFVFFQNIIIKGIVVPTEK
ncbi:MAG: ABC transporter permease subunit [Candidatus Cloacimonadales bacterium]